MNIFLRVAVVGLLGGSVGFRALPAASAEEMNRPAPGAPATPASMTAALPPAPSDETAAPTPEGASGGTGGLLGVFDRGGWVMWVLLLMSVAGGAFAAERTWILRRKRQLPDALMDRLRADLAEGGVNAARARLAGDDSALARVMDAVLARSGASRRELEAAIDDEAGRVYAALRDNLRPVGLTASLSPMVGLLGTVFGLIAAFQVASDLGMDDPRQFAGGIYAALYTTAYALVIAVPMLIAHQFLRARAEAMVREAERLALSFVLGASSPRGGAGNGTSVAKAPAPAGEKAA